MLGVTLTEYDRQVYEEQLKDFLPEQIIDMHAHIWQKSFMEKAEMHRGGAAWPDRVAADCTYEDLCSIYAHLFPGKSVRPVLMGWPLANLKKTNDYIESLAVTHRLPAFYCTAYNTPLEQIERAMTEQGFCGIKPYLSQSPPYIPNNEIRIFDFLPPEQLALLDRLGGVVLLHISRPERLRDPVNLAQLMEIEEKYQNLHLIVAHIGRAYATEDIGKAFDTLRHTKNMVFDFSANVLDEAMDTCLEAVGPQRLLFGSDLPITKMRMYRITENGVYFNVVPRGLYGDVSGDANMRETDETQITTFLYEELCAFRRCAIKIGLTQSEVNDVMYRNASRLFAF